MMRHGIEARQGRNRPLAGSVHESPAPKGDAGFPDFDRQIPNANGPDIDEHRSRRLFGTALTGGFCFLLS